MHEIFKTLERAFKLFGVFFMLLITVGPVWFAFWFLTSGYYGVTYDMDFGEAGRKALLPSLFYTLLFLGIPFLGAVGFGKALIDFDRWLSERKYLEIWEKLTGSSKKQQNEKDRKDER